MPTDDGNVARTADRTEYGMQVRQLKIINFRGIGSLDWKPQSPLCCLIGVGDTGKSTVLDAILFQLRMCEVGAFQT